MTCSKKDSNKPADPKVKRLHHPGPHHYHRPLAKRELISILNKILHLWMICWTIWTSVRGTETKPYMRPEGLLYPTSMASKQDSYNPANPRVKRPHPGRHHHRSSFGKAGVNIEIVHATTSVKDTLKNLNLGEKNQIETVNETGAPDVRADLGLPGVRINCVGDRESSKALFEAIPREFQVFYLG